MHNGEGLAWARSCTKHWFNVDGLPAATRRHHRPKCAAKANPLDLVLLAVAFCSASTLVLYFPILPPVSSNPLLSKASSVGWPRRCIRVHVECWFASPPVCSLSLSLFGNGPNVIQRNRRRSKHQETFQLTPGILCLLAMTHAAVFHVAGERLRHSHGQNLHNCAIVQ
jgi:hypothetical protein